MVFHISVVLARADGMHLVYEERSGSLLRERAVEVLPEFVLPVLSRPSPSQGERSFLTTSLFPSKRELEGPGLELEGKEVRRSGRTVRFLTRSFL